jgi:NTP pyrophosphatase (non-canonical NTP hydrolase)
MNPNEYQEMAVSTSQFPKENGLVYTALGLGNEAGEYQGKIKKYLRGDYKLTPEVRLMLADELGDVAWYLATCADQLGYALEEILEMNVEKVMRRVKNNTVRGNGDSR